ncbi:HlyD family efflux transporter periplasmic adaptor subunit [Planctomicrobium sp. SH664]|uniref:HlyD family efflux transporter periplasmic adaptor subunit n=1 Tax=Planctomicrobium sp. SH664 TaxID=3448125 RepID=UPI003F5AE757
MPDRQLWLGQLINVTRAAGGAIWQQRASHSPVVLVQIGLGEESLEQAQRQWPGHAEKLQEVFESGRAKAMNAQFEQGPGLPATTLRLMLLPLPEVQGVLELFFTQGEITLPEVEQALATFRLTANRTPAPASEANAGLAEAYAEWLSRVHAHLGFAETCFALANESRVWAGCDRVSLATCDSIGARLQAISGLENFDRRSEAVRALEHCLAELISQSVTSDETWPECFDSAGDAVPALATYAQQAGAARVLVVPLVGKEPSARNVPLGLLVFENFRGTSPSRSAREIQFLAPQASRALEHAFEYQRARAGLWHRTAAALTGGRFNKSAAVLCLLGLAAAGLTLIPAPVIISGTGHLEPALQHDLFANANGIVEELFVRHAQPVAAGAPVLRLHSPELDLEISKLTGELVTVTQQIADLETLRGERRPNDQIQSANELAARGEEYKTVKHGLEQQLAILKRQQQELTLTSPIQGHVLTWELEQLLLDRPVNRADRLVTVADLTGPWEARLQVDYRDIGPVLAAIADKTASVSFVAADDPAVRHPATIQDVAPRLQTEPGSGPVLLLTAGFERDSSSPELRPGSVVQYRIRCGRGPIGYVWFRRLLDRVQGWWNL